MPVYLSFDQSFVQCINIACFFIVATCKNTVMQIKLSQESSSCFARWSQECASSSSLLSTTDTQLKSMQPAMASREVVMSVTNSENGGLLSALSHQQRKTTEQLEEEEEQKVEEEEKGGEKEKKRGGRGRRSRRRIQRRRGRRRRRRRRRIQRRRRRRRRRIQRRKRRRIVLQSALTSHLYTLCWMVSPVAFLPPET